MTKDLPDFLSEIVSAAVEAASFRTGLEANLPEAPALGDIWLAYDTFILHVCFVPGVWKNINFLYLLLAGGTMTGAINMGGNKITSLANPTADQDAATGAFVVAGIDAEVVARNLAIAAEATARANADALRLLLTGGTMTGAINMGGNKITSLANPTVAQDAATRAWVLLQVAGFLLLTGGTMSGAIAMGNNKITGLAAPTAAADAARKTEVDTVNAKLDDVSHSSPTRSVDTAYHNGSKLRLVTISVGLDNGERAQAKMGSSSSTTTVVADLHDSPQCVSFIVPPNWYYRLEETEGTIAIEEWYEWNLL
ncbi:hypothetical protein ES708_20585 [subsurface metagenome]